MYLFSKKSFFKWLFQFIHLPAVGESCSSSTSSPTLGIVSLFHFSNSDDRIVVSLCGFKLNFPNELDCIFKMFWLLKISFFVKRLSKYFAHFWLGSLSFYSRFVVLQAFWIQVICWIFVLSVWLAFPVFYYVCYGIEAFNFNGSTLSGFSDPQFSRLSWYSM